MQGTVPILDENLAPQEQLAEVIARMADEWTQRTRGSIQKGCLAIPRKRPRAWKEIPRKVPDASTPYSQVTWGVQGPSPSPDRPQWAHLMVGLPLQALPASWV